MTARTQSQKYNERKTGEMPPPPESLFHELTLVVENNPDKAPNMPNNRDDPAGSPEYQAGCRPDLPKVPKIGRDDDGGALDDSSGHKKIRDGIHTQVDQHRGEKNLPSALVALWGTYNLPRLAPFNPRNGTCSQYRTNQNTSGMHRERMRKVTSPVRVWILMWSPKRIQ
ncbi:uncharacterized protein PODANS_6_9785 [Podospora anserina S mat+]|uniref:Podospora anserina S mat+ genomic DNA chromosome 6, supercontig 4 n=1 Tax=Podospora anserina (strain S / ATCC MYA-4624 / DSM 980 / FGSC 10383) TaxID=515849 RepID=B2ANQ7_PODAN|nr:uncharacterized protein PODANS_6_9785 [Podospora anserina S mat+]CAP65479.1 unnamed protein product [Podospora anserina S mat+]CDP31474.1 Putative protein of unknown function [Podospora anserina S mat+]